MILIVYLITNLVNGKRYVGKTKRTLIRRWYEHVYHAKAMDTEMILYDAIRKHGEHAFEKTILSEIFAEGDDEAWAIGVLNREEKMWIADLKPEYNGTEGGDGLQGYKHTTATKAKMSEARKGAKNHNYGKKWGRQGPHSDETKDKIAVSRTGIGHSPETCAKISDALRKRVRKTKQVIQKRDGAIVAIFSSAKEAAATVDGNHCHIRECCLGTTNRRTHRGYDWSYSE